MDFRSEGTVGHIAIERARSDFLWNRAGGIRPQKLIAPCKTPVPQAGIAISGLDYAIVVLYLLGIVGVGIHAGLKSRKSKSEASGYFLAAQSLKWPEIELALFATNISCVHFVSLAPAGFDQGLLMGNFEWLAGFTLILLSLFFVPFYIRSNVSTLPDFLEKRYCRQCRDWLAVVSIVAAIIFHIAFPLVTGWFRNLRPRNWR